MAKKKRRTASQDAEQGMNKLMKTMSRLMERPPPNAAGMANRIAVAADSFAEALDKRGIRCICSYKGKSRYTGKYSGKTLTCSCRPKRKGERSLSGLHCRDAQGRFVPVGQCRGPVARDPKTGRFMSLLKAEMK